MNRNDYPLTSEYGRACRGTHATRGSGSSSLAHVHPRALACALTVFSLCLAFMAQPALAATWPISTSGLSATLAFHQSYTAGIDSYVHSGIDIPASAGMQISSPLAGTVRFTGTVPSGDSRTSGSSSAKTMNAVSIELANGRVITLMPFASIAVHEGQVVAEGASLGTLAAGGDVSTPTTHLHMGYKEGSSYLDPMLLFGAAPSASHGVGVSSAEAPAAAAPAEAARAMSNEPSAVIRAQPDAASTVGGVSSASADGFGAIETGGYELSQREGQAHSPAAFIMDALDQLGGACAGQFAGLLEALSELSGTTGISLPALIAGTCALAPCALLAFALVCVRRFVSQRRDILETQRTRLPLVFGGGSMHKLFPASGAAFMSRSRIAQRR